MILVIYKKNDGRVLGYTRVDSDLKITDDSIIGRDIEMGGVNFDEVDYGYYEDAKLSLNKATYLKDLQLIETQPPDIAVDLTKEISTLKSTIDSLKATVIPMKADLTKLQVRTKKS